MYPETLQLEALRQQIEEAEYEIGSQSDYVDYGKPNAAQKKKAEELILRLREQSQQAKGRLHEALITIRSEKPEALAEWVNYHKGILERITAEQVTDSNSAARRNVAQSTLNQWEKVLAGEQEYVNINWHFLKDYKAEVKKLAPQSVVTSDDAKKTWWQFWK